MRRDNYLSPFSSRARASCEHRQNILNFVRLVLDHIGTTFPDGKLGSLLQFVAIYPASIERDGISRYLFLPEYEGRKEFDTVR